MLILFIAFFASALIAASFNHVELIRWRKSRPLHWTGRAMEKRADRIAKNNEGTDLAYAQALEKIYVANHMPAVNPKSNVAVHPDLYDRMIAAGITPDYPRPEPPSTWALTGILGTTSTVLLIVITLVH